MALVERCLLHDVPLNQALANWEEAMSLLTNTPGLNREIDHAYEQGSFKRLRLLSEYTSSRQSF